MVEEKSSLKGRQMEKEMDGERYMHMHIYIYIYRERERKTERKKERENNTVIEIYREILTAQRKRGRQEIRYGN